MIPFVNPLLKETYLLNYLVLARIIYICDT